VGSYDHIYCNVSTEMPREVWRRWEPYIDWARMVMVNEGVNDKIIELHWHEVGWLRGCSFLGLCDENELYLCPHRAPSKITILHEIAHALTPDLGHGDTWAAELLRLNNWWLTPRRALRANRSHAYSYRSFRRIWRRHSGERLIFRGFPHHTDAATRTRWNFKHRSRLARALRHVRTFGEAPDAWGRTF
jgi:hypothetical protein